jgi:hypothetical protein
MGLTLLSDCSFQIGLDSSDFSFSFQAQETQSGTRCTQLGSISRRSTSYPVLLSFPSLSIKQDRLAVAERNLMEFVMPAVSCPIECNRLLVCVRISCGFRRAACLRAPACRLSARSGVRMARALWQQACPLASWEQFSRELLQTDCSCLALRRRPPPAAAATAPGTVACSGSSGPGGLQLWPVLCQHSLTVTGTDSRDDSDGRFLTVLSIYVGPGQQTITRRNLN